METKQRNRILTLLLFGVLMGALDIAILAPALPSIRAEFSVDERSLAWIFSSYILFKLVSTPLMAKLSDLYGRRWVYILDILLLALGSLMVAVSADFPLLILGRAIQGFGAGGIFPVASAVIGDTFPPEKRGSALGMIGAVFGVAFLIGPLLGGVILALASWRWLFLINLPIALAIIAASLRLLPASRSATIRRFDAPGMILLGLFLAALTLGLNQLDAANLPASLLSLPAGGSLAIALILLVILIRVETRAEQPLLPARLFNRRQLRLTYALSAGAGLVEASLVFVPLMAVSGLASQGINERNATWLLIPAVICMAIGAPLGGRLLDRVGSRNVILAGSSVMTLGLVVFALFGTSIIFFLVSGMLVGLGLTALLGAPIRYIMLSEARAEERTFSQGIITLFTSVGQLTGSAIISAMVASFGSEGAFSGYRAAFFLVAIFSIALIFLAALLQRRERELEMLTANETFSRG
ncbi:MAG: MFS transporter [Chloroflexota bacterium]